MVSFISPIYWRSWKMRFFWVGHFDFLFFLEKTSSELICTRLYCSTNLDFHSWCLISENIYHLQIRSEFFLNDLSVSYTFFKMFWMKWDRQQLTTLTTIQTFLTQPITVNSRFKKDLKLQIHLQGVRGQNGVFNLALRERNIQVTRLYLKVVLKY